MMFEDLLLSQVTKKELLAIAGKPPHALLISGSIGSGKKYLATIFGLWLAKGIKTNLLIVESVNESIGIEKVKQVIKFTQLKANSDQPRVVVIPDIDRLTDEAANSLLKTLEEPGDKNYFLLTSSRTPSIRKTILSRCQQLSMTLPSESEIVNYLQKKGVNAKDSDDLIRRCGRSIGAIMKSIICTEKPNLLTFAKEILLLSVTDRLKQVDVIAKDQNKCMELLESITKIAIMAVKSKNYKQKDISRWYCILENTSHAKMYLSANVNPRLVLSKLMIVL